MNKVLPSDHGQRHGITLCDWIEQGAPWKPQAQILTIEAGLGTTGSTERSASFSSRWTTA